jgi:hypothetical protein
LFNVLVLVLLYAVIISIVDAACFKEDSSFTFVSFNKEGVCLNNLKILLNSILIYIDVVHREESLLLVFAKGINLLADRYL